MKKERKIRGVLMSIMGISEDVAFDYPIITMTGLNDLEVDNYKNIVKYSSESLKINTVSGLIIINGTNLVIKEIEFVRLNIRGTIKSIEFESDARRD